MTQLFFTDSRALARPLVIDTVTFTLPEEARDCLERAAIGDDVPFILDDAGAYDPDLNRFFRTCATMGVRSAHSLKAYARDLVTWLRFLSEHRAGRSIWQGDREDIAAYHAARRRSQPCHRISAASWNRSVAALEKFYNWALEEGLVARSPFTHGTAWRRAPGGRLVAMRVNRGYERAARHGDMRFVDLERYRQFRDVGLRGLASDDHKSVDWRGRHGERNALFAELLVTTGLRLSEAASLLLIELPQSQDTLGRAAKRSIPYRVAAATAKGNKAREIRLPLRLLRRLIDYAELERANILARRASQFASADTDAIRMIAYDGGAVTIADGKRETRIRLDLLSPADRQRLVYADTGAPVLLWLAENGRPMTTAAWETVFCRARARCSAARLDLAVTPHALRHTFAVHMLSMLIRAQIGSVLRDRRDDAGAAAYRRMIGDPLQKLQRLLGHASIASTYIYLDSLEESRSLVEAAAERWSDEMEALS